MAVLGASLGLLPSRRRPPPCAAQGGRARCVPTGRPLQRPARRAARFRAASSAASGGGGSGSPAGGGGAQLEDANWVQTALNEAVAQEDYARASQCVPRAVSGPRVTRRGALR